ncbi:hypothetical protein [Tenacibaculum sp.]|uniref:hypothetical protein n=1 Tax=Tenacibaculum sp. TaxID=1906242 RepID=UPI003D0BA0E0
MIVEIKTIRTKTFTARIIHFGMFLWAIFNGLKLKQCYNHCEVKFGELTSGAIAQGIKTRKWQTYVDEHKGKYFKTHTYNFTFSDEEWRKAQEYLNRAENTPYEFENFWYHAVKIFTGKWKGSTKPTELYCYEHGIRVLNCKNNIDLNTNLNPYEAEIVFGLLCDL